MILLQTPLSQNVPLAVAEAVGFLIAATLLGWWLARLILAGRTRVLREAIVGKQAELDDCRKAPAPRAGAPLARPAPVLPISPPIVDPVRPVVEPLPPIGGGVTTDDLKILEGVGPKIEDLLHDAGIKTFATLAATPPARLKQILDAAGPQYQIHDPGTWPEQARLAAEGRWDELKAWQIELNKGRIQ